MIITTNLTFGEWPACSAIPRGPPRCSIASPTTATSSRPATTAGGSRTAADPTEEGRFLLLAPPVGLRPPYAANSKNGPRVIVVCHRDRGVLLHADRGSRFDAYLHETMIWPPFFAVAACWCARMEVLSIIWISPSCAALMASIRRSHTPAFRHRLKRCSRWCAGHSARAGHATARRIEAPRRCRSARPGHRRAVHLWAYGQRRFYDSVSVGAANSARNSCNILSSACASGTPSAA